MSNHLKKKYVLISIIAGLLVLICFGIWQFNNRTTLVLGKQQEQDLSDLLEQRKAERFSDSTESNVFGEDDIVKILVIGLDNRVGDTQGHCDAIQFVEINKAKASVDITAVPRGTFARLPGSGHKPGDYYLANACGIGGLQYGVSEIERVAGIKADYLIFVGFSEVVGILRQLKLPTTETLQFLRQRQGYAIGEPQRAHNHSTFLKHLLVNYLPAETSSIDLPFQYLLYSFTRTDMSFDEARILYESLVAMKLNENSGNIKLYMRPAYTVADIPYDPETVGDYVDNILYAISPYLPEHAYVGKSIAEIQETLLAVIAKNKADKDFINWSYDNQLWLQIEDSDKREKTHYEIMEIYVDGLSDKKEAQLIVEDYILEMEYLGLTDWANKGKKLLREIVS